MRKLNRRRFIARGGLGAAALWAVSPASVLGANERVNMANISHRIWNRKVLFDPASERFVDNDAANALVKRRYRKKFELQEQV